MKKDWNSRLALLLIGGILVVLNLIGLNLFGRLDLTDDKVYSLSPASIKMVENLEDPVTLTAYFTDDLPAPYSSNRRFLQDKLADYRAYGGPNIQYKFVDPAGEETLEAEATRLQIPTVQIQVVESDNLQLKNAHMGLAIQYGGDRETIPVIQDISTLEYDITSAIRRLTRESLPSVGFLSGHGELQPSQAMRTFYDQLGRNYERQIVSINDSLASLSASPDVLVITSPADSFPPHHLEAIDAYLMNGGRAAIFINRVMANLQAGQAFAFNTGLESLLASYGVHIAENLVMDQQSSAITVQRQQGLFNIAQQIEYPFFPIATNFNSENRMVNRLSNVMFYFASSVDTSAALPEQVHFEPLIMSSSKSQIQEGFFMIQPGLPGQENLSGGPYIMAGAYTGSFPSAYNNKISEDSRLVVIGDGDFLNETLLGTIPGNIELGLNVVDWLVQDEALLGIRSKKTEPRTLGETSDAARPLIKYANMFGPALLVVLFGLVRWRQRKSRQIILAGSSDT